MKKLLFAIILILLVSCEKEDIYVKNQYIYRISEDDFMKYYSAEFSSCNDFTDSLLIYGTPYIHNLEIVLTEGSEPIKYRMLRTLPAPSLFYVEIVKIE